MANVVVGNGTTVTSTVSPGANFSVLITAGGSVAVAGDTAMVLAGGNSVTVAGEVMSTTHGIISAVARTTFTSLLRVG